MSANPWAYAIDYDESIRDGEAELLQIEALLPIAAHITREERTWSMDLAGFALSNLERAAMVGLTAEAAHCLADYHERWEDAWYTDDLPQGSYERGEAIDKRLAAM